MPRTPRIYLDEGVFHILARGNNKQRIFQDDEDFLIYKRLLKKVKEDHPHKLYHHCLMNNHIHLIIETNQKTDLSKMMKRLNLFYYNHYKKKYGYAGHFWQDRFKSLIIQADEYLLTCGLYIESNPVRAKIVKLAQDYPHSSYKYYAYGIEDGLTDRDIFYDELGQSDKNRQEEYRKLILDEQKQISSSIFKQLFLGDKEFIKKMERRFKVSNIRLKRGRPSKIK